MLWIYMLEELKCQKKQEGFMKKDCKRAHQTECRIEKVISKDDKLNVKKKCYENSFNTWINKNILCKYII